MVGPFRSPVALRTQQLTTMPPNLVRSDSEVMPEDKFLIQSLPLTPGESQDKLSSSTVSQIFLFDVDLVT